MKFKKLCRKCEQLFRPEGGEKICSCCRKIIRLEGIKKSHESTRSRQSIFNLYPGLRKAKTIETGANADFYKFKLISSDQ